MMRVLAWIAGCEREVNLETKDVLHHAEGWISVSNPHCLH